MAGSSLSDEMRASAVDTMRSVSGTRKTLNEAREALAEADRILASEGARIISARREPERDLPSSP